MVVIQNFEKYGINKVNITELLEYSVAKFE